MNKHLEATAAVLILLVVTFVCCKQKTSPTISAQQAKTPRRAGVNGVAPVDTTAHHAPSDPEAPDALIAADTSIPLENLDAVLWMQSSVEYRAACQQTYVAAGQTLPQALKDRDWSALAEKTEGVASDDALPPAVILDVDETILNNSAYQARLIVAGQPFSLDTWHVWVKQAQAEALPGVQAFVAQAREMGVTVFFVTNRDAAVEAATRRNLERLDICRPGEVDTILSKNERDEWGSDKTTRRNFVAQRYRVLMLIGDDLNDFLWAGWQVGPQERAAAAADHAALWGTRWFILPNPSYGNWERALYRYQDVDRDQMLVLKRRHLDTESAPAPPAINAAEQLE